MSLLSEMRRPHRIADEGVPISYAIKAIRVVEASEEIRDKRFLAISLHPNGMLFVRTGESIGGYLLALRRAGEGWEIAEWSLWCS